jgi:prepilin-type N-terminal cleavage/methylation domain
MHSMIMTKREKVLPSGFTMVEILVILAIISLLIGLIVSGADSVRRKSKVYQAQAMIASLETALALYHVDFGAYPAAGNLNMVTLLTDSVNLGGNPEWRGPYMSFKENDLTGKVPNATVIDPWKHAYGYDLPGIPEYRIWSAGPNGIDEDGAGDDIKSW